MARTKRKHKTSVLTLTKAHAAHLLAPEKFRNFQESCEVWIYLSYDSYVADQKMSARKVIIWCDLTLSSVGLQMQLGSEERPVKAGSLFLESSHGFAFCILLLKQWPVFWDDALLSARAISPGQTEILLRVSRQQHVLAAVANTTNRLLNLTRVIHCMQGMSMVHHPHSALGAWRLGNLRFRVLWDGGLYLRTRADEVISCQPWRNNRRVKRRVAA